MATANDMRRLTGSPGIDEKSERDDYDCYITDPVTVAHLLAGLPGLGIDLPQQILEPGVAIGSIAGVCKRLGYDVICRDIKDYGYAGTVTWDFLSGPDRPTDKPMAIIMNPPYKTAAEHINAGLNMLRTGEYLCALLRLQFLEGKKRREFFKTNPPLYVCVFSERQHCKILSDWDKPMAGLICFAWFIWQKGYQDLPRLTWFPADSRPDATTSPAASPHQSICASPR